MAPIAASITVNFTANYTGQHRICWRLGSSGPYDCTTLISTTAGMNYSVIIPVTVDNETCSSVGFEGYVQATCEDESSSSGRIPFSVTFTPSPDCLPIDISCTAVGILEFEMVNNGSGYNAGAPTVTLSSGTGTGTAVVGLGAPIATLLTNPGVGMTIGTYLAEPAAAIAGVGVGATFDVEVAGGIIISADHNPGTGTGYVGGVDTLNFPGITGSGTEIVSVTTDDLDTIVSITVGVPGSYSSVPTVVIDPPPAGVTATALVILDNCADAWLSGDNCNGDAYDAYPISPALGESFAMCNLGAIDPGTLPAGYTVSVGDPLTECCYDCVDVTITHNNPGADPIDYAYIDCNPLNVTYKNFLSGSLADGANITLNCVVNNSWAFSGVTGVSVVTAPTSC